MNKAALFYAEQTVTVHIFFLTCEPKCFCLSKGFKKSLGNCLQFDTNIFRFRFYATIGVFYQKKIVFRLPSIKLYMARRQNFSCRSCKLARSLCLISVIVHNTYCVKCSLSYTADYTGLCSKSLFIFWLIRQ